MPQECLKIIKSKSKVRQSRAKAVDAKVSMSSSTPAISSDVAELKDMDRALLLDKKNQSSAPAHSPTPAPVKTVEPNCVTCGGTHSYQNCPATNGNVYRKNIHEYVSQAAVANYNKGNTGFRPQMVANQIRPYGFPPVQIDQNNQNNFNQGNNFNQNRGGNFNQGGMDECLALADLGASINLMPLFVWEGLSLSKLTPNCMTIELADPSVFKPIGITKDVSVKGELTLRIENKAITYNLDQTARYSANYNQMTANKIDVIDMACKEYSQEVIVFFDVTTSGNPTPYDDPIISITSPTLTPFRDSDFLLFEEADAFIGLEDDLNSPKINPFYYDLNGDILLLEAILNSEPLPPLPNHEQYMPSFKKELKVCEAKTVKSSVDEPSEVELKDLPPHLKYAFLEG
nr:reverse transcriptase domain-containing protein [Tanacetum cinerariifolium]